MIHTEQVLGRDGVLDKILVSYHNEEGKKQLLSFKVPQSELFEWEETNSGQFASTTFKSAFGNHVKKVPLRKYRTLSKHRIYELFNSLPADLKEKIYAPNQPIKTFFDIETESHGEFPNVNNPKHKVLTNAFVTGNQIDLYGIKPLQQEDIVTIERNIKEHFKSLRNQSLITKDYKVKYHYFETEREMLSAIFSYIRTDVHMLLGWNCLKFDMMYLANRSVTIDGMDLYGVEKNKLDYGFYKSTSETRSKFDLRLVDKFSPDVKIIVPVPYHTPVLDYMAVMEQFDYPKRSKYSLDYISDEILEGVKKVEYSLSLQELYEQDFVKFCFYNIVDTILVQLIDLATDIFSIVPTLSSVAQVPIHDALFAGQMCERKFQTHYYDQNMVFVNKQDENAIGSYEGGLVKEPIVGIANYVMVYDFASKFPSGMMAFNLGIDSLVGRRAPDDDFFIHDKTGKKTTIDLSIHITAPNGYIYTKENGDSSLRTMIFDLFNGRIDKKNKAKEVELEIKLLTESDSRITQEFKHCIFKALDEISDDQKYMELERLLKLAKKYANESQAMKIIMNSIYGVLGYRFFPLYNLPVASTVTAQSRDLLQYTIDITNDLFMTKWLDMKDIHEQLGIVVNNNVPRQVVYYADTDSIMVNMEHVLDSSNWTKKKDHEATRDLLLQIDEILLRPFYKEQFRLYCRKNGAFETRPDGKESFNLGLEEIEYKVLFVKKKRYIKNPIWSDGKLYKPNEKLSFKGVEVAKPSFPKFIREKLAQVMKNIMAQEGDLDMFSVAREVRLVKEEFMNARVEDVCEANRVNGFLNSIVSENPLMFVSGAPMAHRASAIYNNLIKTDESLKRFPLITNGQKVAIYQTMGTDKTNDVFAFPMMSGMPDKAPKMDKKRQFEKMILSPINNIISRIDTNLKLEYDLYVIDTQLW